MNEPIKPGQWRCLGGHLHEALEPGEKGLPGWGFNELSYEERSRACDGTRFSPPDGALLPEGLRWSSVLDKGVVPAP